MILQIDSGGLKRCFSVVIYTISGKDMGKVVPADQTDFRRFKLFFCGHQRNQRERTCEHLPLIQKQFISYHVIHTKKSN
jgi:hypothetical protein